jgi:hypothetical protein
LSVGWAEKTYFILSAGSAYPHIKPSVASVASVREFFSVVSARGRKDVLYLERGQRLSPYQTLRDLRARDRLPSQNRDNHKIYYLYNINWNYIENSLNLRL